MRRGNEGRLLLRSNQEWAVDFAYDALATGRGIRILAIVDAFTRECLTLEVETILSSARDPRLGTGDRTARQAGIDSL